MVSTHKTKDGSQICRAGLIVLPKFYFPATREKLPEMEYAKSMAAFTGRGESIVIVDDVPEQREIVSKMLTKLGLAIKQELSRPR